MPELTESEAVPADFEGDAFDDWIGGATVSKRSVPIYGKPGLFAEWEQLERDIEIAEAEEAGGAELGGSKSSKLKKRREEIYHEWMDSKSDWIVRGLDEDDLKEITDELEAEGIVEPDALKKPAEPKPLPTKHTEQQGKTHTLATNEYEIAKAEYEAALPDHQKAVTAYADELNLRIIATAVDRIDFASGRTQDEITVEQLRKLKKTLGERQLLKLIQASQLAMFQEPEIHAPFSRDSSEDAPT
jgi:hypothetical protein